MHYVNQQHPAFEDNKAIQLSSYYANYQPLYLNQDFQVSDLIDLIKSLSIKYVIALLDISYKRKIFFNQ